MEKIKNTFHWYFIIFSRLLLNDVICIPVGLDHVKGFESSCAILASHVLFYNWNNWHWIIPVILLYIRGLIRMLQVRHNNAKKSCTFLSATPPLPLISPLPYAYEAKYVQIQYMFMLLHLSSRLTRLSWGTRWTLNKEKVKSALQRMLIS